MTQTFTPTVSNVLAIYNLATADDLREGLSWYTTAHNWCVSHTRGRAYLARRNAGIVAALSPMNGWGNNKRKAAALISMRARIDLSVPGKNGIGLGKNVEKAIRIYKGEDPLDVLGGDKVRAFYRTILDPTGDYAPVIDRHAFDIAIGMRTDDAAKRGLKRKGAYEAFGDVYREAAKIAGISPSQMQAVTWIAWRNLHGVKAD